MTVWFTSDTHFGHANIIKFCGRPWDSVEEMNEGIIERWNSVVDKDDTVFHLGDVALGPIHDSLALIKRLNGYKYLVPGNHDRCWSHWGHKNDYQRNRWEEAYRDVGFDILDEYVELSFGNGWRVGMCHLPYDGDSQEEARYAKLRPTPGLPLIHGHIHTTDRARSMDQFHVGMDAWRYYPVHEDVIMDWLNGLDTARR